MKKKTGILLSIFSLAVLYLTLSSTIIVQPGTVAIIRELRSDGSSLGLVDRPLANNREGRRLFFKQPVIPGTGIGYVEEIYDSLTPYSFETSFALYTLDQVTGNVEDKDKVRAYTISGTIGDILNWETFLRKLNVDEINKNRSVYSRQYENRVEILSDQLKYLMRTGSPEQLYPYGAGTEEPVMNLGQKIAWLQQELVSRRNFLAAVHDKYQFQDPDYYREFLMTRTPWYWVMGIDRFETLINQAESLREYEQSYYNQLVTRKGNANKYIANEDYLYLVNMMGKVHYYEQNLLSSEETLKNLQNYLRKIYNEINADDMKLAEAVTEGFSRYLINESKELIEIPQESLTSLFSQYLNEDLQPILVQAVSYNKLRLNIDYLNVYEQQILNSYEYDDKEQEEVDKIYSYILKNYSEILKKENWENYMASVNKEYNKILEANPFFEMPPEKIQVLANFKLYSHYLTNIEPVLQRDEIGENHYLYPLMAILNSYGELFLSDKDTVKQTITAWLQNSESDFIKGAASLVNYKWQRERTMSTMANLEDLKTRELEPYIFFESRNYDIDESEKLWDAAIENILSGSELQEERTFTFHRVGENETISSISRMHNVNPLDVFYENRFTMEFSDTERRSDLNYRMEYESVSDIFGWSRNLELKSDQDIYIPGNELYSDSWLNLHENKQELREYYINRYVFSNLEKMVTDAFYAFINKTDYLEHFEQDYGVEFSDLSFSIEDRSFFSNPRTGEIDSDFIDLYYNIALR